MKPLPLDQISWNWESHKSALWWLGLLYSSPIEFRLIFEHYLKKYTKVKTVLISIKLYILILPIIILFILINRLLIFEVIGIPIQSTLNTLTDHLFFHLYGIAFGIALGIAFGISGAITGAVTGAVTRESTEDFIGRISGGIAGGIAIGITGGIAFGIVFGTNGGTAGAIAVGIVVGIAFGIPGGCCINAIAVAINVGIAFGIAGGMTGGIIGGVAFGIAGGIIGITGIIDGGIGGKTFFGISIGVVLGIGCGIVGGIVGRIFGGIAGGISVGIAGGIAIIISVNRLYYFPFHLVFIFLSIRYPWLKLHPVYWDDLFWVPFPGLERILVAHAEANYNEGTKEIERIIDNYPSQRNGALKAKTILIARRTAKVNSLCEIETSINQLPEGKKGFVSQTPKIKEMVRRICQLQNQLDTMNRPFLKAPLANELYTRIENFKHEIAGYKEPLVTEFRKAADNWLQIARKQVKQTQAILKKEPTPQVFRAGDPVNRAQEAFIPRYRVLGNLEQQVMLSTGCPGLVLYGRRRMGKTTILNSLSGFLPDTVQSVFISMQSARAFSSLAALNQLLLDSLSQALLPIKLKADSLDSLTGFFELLNISNSYLQTQKRRLLICLDEYETLDMKIGDQTFSEDLLATLRESIQTHRQLTWVFAGSHEITELKHAPWTSYLVSARTLEVPLFTPNETRLLLTEPMKYSSLWAKDDPKRPRFEPDFWGENGIERLHEQAGGWPHLVQLIAETIVDLVNDSEQSQADAAIFEQALNQSIVKGHNVLYELMHRECTLPGEWEYLSTFRRKTSQPLPADEAIYRSLKRRLLVVEENGEFRLRVPLMERWLKERG